MKYYTALAMWAAGFGIVTPALGFTDYYVDDNGAAQPGFNPSAPLGSLNRPYSSVQAAFDVTGPGDTVFIRAGIYYAGSTSNNARVLKIDINDGGTVSAPIIVQAFPGEAVAFDGQGADTGPHHLIEILGSHVVISGLELRNVKENGLLIREPAHHVTIRLCEVHDFSLAASTRAGIMVSGPCRHITIEDNHVYGYGGVGIFLDDNGGLAGTDRVPPTGSNSSYPEVPPALWDSWLGYVGVAPRYCVVQRNLVHGMNSNNEGSDGIAINYAVECIIQDNIVFANYDDNIDGLGATRCTFARNIVFAANPFGLEGGDGNGMKIGVRGALSNLVHRNVAFENPRAGIDMTLSYRSAVHNNTAVDNGWRGLSYGDTVGQMLENPSAVTFKNNLCIDGGSDTFAMAKSAATLTELMDNASNAVSDNNEHGSENAWTLPLGRNGLINQSATQHFANPGLAIDTVIPAGLNIPQRFEFIRSQVFNRFSLNPASPLVDGGTIVPGVIENYIGNGPDIGAFEHGSCALVTIADCNLNGSADSCDLADGLSIDCDSNGVPDECEPDCNGNGIVDGCDILDGLEVDCNEDGVPDACQIADIDCNANGLIDECEIAAGLAEDCTANGVPDECEADCDGDGVADVCEVMVGGVDCNNNSVPDDCELALGFAEDCNGNSVPDDCELDCDGNGTVDACDAPQCGDFNVDCISDSPCMWWDRDDTCLAIPRDFADVGGPFGSCPPDDFVNTHDHAMVRLCFAGAGVCDSLNIDIGGPFADCAPDSYCNVHDSNHVLRVFEGISTCSCGGGGPAGGAAPEVPTGGATRVAVVASRRQVAPGNAFSVHVFMEDPVLDIQSYQVELAVTGGMAGTLVLEGIEVESRSDHVFHDVPGAFTAINVNTGQMFGSLDSRVGTQAPAGRYLVTYTYRPSADANGTFVIDARHDRANGGQTVLIAGAGAEVVINGTKPGVVTVHGDGSSLGRVRAERRR